MGMPYALLKRDKPEVFDLGKGGGMMAWPAVFGRVYGSGVFGEKNGNFEEPFTAPDDLADDILTHCRDYSGPPNTVARRIRAWMGSDACFLINYWEELSFLIEEDDRARIAEEFRDLAPVLCAPLWDYKQTGDVWGG